MTQRDIEGIRDYNAPAGGWGALKATAIAIAEEMHLVQASEALLHANKPSGFDCPGCAWPDKVHTSTFQFCENGAKAITWEATKKRASPEFFAQHTVQELLTWTDHALEDTGRLTHPMAYDKATDTYQPISWEAAFERVASILNAQKEPTSVGLPKTIGQPAHCHVTDNPPCPSMQTWGIVEEIIQDYCTVLLAGRL